MPQELLQPFDADAVQTVTTTFPNCWLDSMKRWALTIRSSGNVFAIIGFKLTAAEHDLGAVQPQCEDAHLNFVGAGRRQFDFLDLENLGAPDLVEPYDTRFGSAPTAWGTTTVGTARPARTASRRRRCPG